ncbi:hypothetical protein [Rhizobacter sp. Root404]|uniref:hypothetical protein n=1 Tax=Rhizobacter sp. Root404 TaxID=1736528 RepID=UPI0006FCC58D|nr:hypothetical protein [Rhizobacter sp. Root404]KQW36759.1 hypothetical protein ASC76_19170 [Rhizobacter sp. Root404]
MPTNTNLSERQFGFGEQQLNVAARPVDVVAAPSASKTQDLLQSIRVFNQGANTVADNLHQEFVKAEQARAQADALKNPDGAEPVYTTDQTPWYTEARVNTWAKVKGMQVAGDMNAQYEALKKKPEEFANTDFKKWTADFIAKNTAGLKDPSAIAGVMPHLMQQAMTINGDAPGLQETVRHNQLVSTFSNGAEAETIKDNYNFSTIETQLADAKAKGIPMSEIVPAYLSAARYGMEKGNYRAAQILDQPMKALGGLTLRMVSAPKDRDNIDALLGKSTKEGNTAKAELLSSEASDLFSKSGVTEASISQVLAKADEMGVKRSEAAAMVASAVNGIQETTGDPSIAKILNAPLAALNGKSIRSVSAIEKQGGIDNMLGKVTQEQKKQMEDERKRVETLTQTQLEDAMETNPDDPMFQDADAWANKTVLNPAFDLTKTKAGMELYIKGRKLAAKANKDAAIQEAYNSGTFRNLPDVTAEDKRNAQIKAEKAMRSSGLSETDQVRRMIDLGVKNDMPSPTLLAKFENIEQMPGKVKDDQGKEVVNPALVQAIVTMDAMRKSGNPQAAAQYLKGAGLAYMNALDVQVNLMGRSLESAVDNAKVWSSPEKVEQLKEMVNNTKQEVLDGIASSMSSTANNTSTIFNTNIHNTEAVRAYASQLYPQYLAAAGGDPKAAQEAMTKELQSRFVGVSNTHDWLSRDEGYAVMLPVGATASPAVAKAFQKVQADLDVKYKASGPVKIVPASERRGETTYLVYSGMQLMPERLSYQDIMAADSNAAAQKALDAGLQSKGVDKDTRAYATGKMTPQALEKQQQLKTQAEVANLNALMSKTTDANQAMQANPAAPVAKGTGPRSNYQYAQEAAHTDPAWAIGVASEGIPKRPYKDNDGGITIGLGYNTKHQSPEQIAKDFSKAGIPNTPQFIEMVKGGQVKLTVPQMQALHSVAFTRYQDKAKEAFDTSYPGAWDGLNQYQKAAIGQLAYNTGWKSKVLKDFLGKVGAGKEEDALRELKVVWHDDKGNPHVNTDLMRNVRAMWQGPDAFKKALTLG